MLKKLLLILIFFFLLPSPVLAASCSISSLLPSEVMIDQNFDVAGEIVGFQAGQVYFIKCRVGNSSSSLTEGQTYNSASNSWLSDGSAWIEMPTTENANFSLQCKVKSGVEPGNKIVFLRVCLKQADRSCGSSFQSSSGIPLTVLAQATATPVPSSTPTLTPTYKPATPTPKLAATYKINEVKDEDGEILASVKVYVDDIYLHHYAPEVLTFCDDCRCDDYVSCGFGYHVFKLEKTGYQNWVEEKTINSSNFYEISPVMTFSSTTKSPTPTISSSPTPTLVLKTSLTPTPKNKIASSSGEILGQNTATLSSFYPYNKPDNSINNQESTPSGQNKFWPKIFLFVGLAMIFSSAFLGWRKLCYTQFK